MRLDKYLSHMGFGTRNDVKKLIKNGWVTINDETIKKADYNVKEDDRVCVDDEPVSYVEYEYYILNKPQGYVSATEDYGLSDSHGTCPKPKTRFVSSWKIGCRYRRLITHQQRW